MTHFMMYYFILILLIVILRYYYKQYLDKENGMNQTPPFLKRSKLNKEGLSVQNNFLGNNHTNELLNKHKVKKQGKSIFTKQEIVEIETLLTELRSVAPTKQKSIRKRLRSIGFYISDYGTGITLEKLHTILKSGEIKIINESNIKTFPIIGKNNVNNKLKKDLCRSFRPIIFNDSYILILGTMPGADSLITGEYYASSSNSFWKIIESIYNDGNKFANYDEKIKCLKKNHISLWDVYSQCERDGSLDSSINNGILNDIDSFLSKHKSIKKIIFNGEKASSAYLPTIEYHILPSTSNSNSYFSLANKIDQWKEALKN